MASTMLSVDVPVSSLQFDMDSNGTVTLEPSVAASKSVATAPVGNITRVVIFGVNQTEFSGKFAMVSAPIASISNVTGAKGDGTNANASVVKLSQVQGVNVQITT